MTRTYLCLFVSDHDIGGFSVFTPDIPSCGSTGDDIEDARAMISECMDLCLEVVLEDTGAVPEPRMSTRAEAIEWFRELMNYPLDGETAADREFDENDLHIEMIEVEVPVVQAAVR